MDRDSQSVVRTICRQILRPLASMTLKCGMTWKEFSDLSKLVFVETATDEYGIRGRPTNVSRVSILTGISRKEVKRQRDLLATHEEPPTRKTNDATKVLSGWFQGPAYVDANLEPRVIPESGPAPSFEALCETYGGDVAVPTMLKELIKTNAVARTADGELRVLSRYYQPAVHDDENLMFAADRIYDVIRTMNNNVFLEEGGTLRFGGYADNDSIPVSVIPEFREYLDKRGQAFLEEVDDWLAARSGNNPGEATARVGISLFATQRENSKE
ncbi:MAG: hypothetical protein HKN37_04675 [Rhodothermales bacterium]|nr:hypothetical protein [Rhodothermales bacterium]